MSTGIKDIIQKHRGVTEAKQYYHSPEGGTTPHAIEAHGVKGMKGTPWRKTFKHLEHLHDWCEKNSADVHGYRDLEPVHHFGEEVLDESMNFPHPTFKTGYSINPGHKVKFQDHDGNIEHGVVTRAYGTEVGIHVPGKGRIVVSPDMIHHKIEEEVLDETAITTSRVAHKAAKEAALRVGMVHQGYENQRTGHVSFFRATPQHRAALAKQLKLVPDKANVGDYTGHKHSIGVKDNGETYLMTHKGIHEETLDEDFTNLWANHFTHPTYKRWQREVKKHNPDAEFHHSNIGESSHQQTYAAVKGMKFAGHFHHTSKSGLVMDHKGNLAQNIVTS